MEKEFQQPVVDRVTLGDDTRHDTVRTGENGNPDFRAGELLNDGVRRDPITGEIIDGDRVISRDPFTGLAVEREETLRETAKPVEIVNSGKTDELSVALAESRKARAVAFQEPEAAPGKYALDYVLKGEEIHETHATVAHALSRVAALQRLGITAATSTL